jgi:hypothetical protein
METSPSFILFKSGVEENQFQPKLEENLFSSWLNRILLPSVTILENQNEIDSFLNEVGHQAIIGYFENKNSLFKELKEFRVESQQSDDFGVAAVFNKEIVSKKGVNLIQIHKNEKEIVDYKETDLKKLLLFIVVNVHPLVGKYGPEIYFRSIQSNLPCFVLYVKENIEDSDAKNLEKIANQLKGKFIFTYSNEVNSEVQLTEMTKNKNSKFPIYAIQYPGTSFKLYFFDQEFNEKELLEWAQNVLDGKLKPSIEQNEEIPNFEPSEEELNEFKKYLDEKMNKKDEL